MPQILRELALLPEKVREVLGQALPWVEATLDVQLPTNLHDALGAIREELRVETVEDVKKLAGPLSYIALTVSGGTKNFFASLGGLLMIPFFAFYLLRDFDHITARAKELLPLRYREEVTVRAREIDVAMSSFVRGQLTVASILAAIYAVGLMLLGVPLGLVVGILAGFGNLVPFLGTAIGVVLATLMVLLDWHGPGQLLAVYGVFALGQTLEGWYLTPKIVGESVGLSPFAVIIAVLVFGELFGFFGLLIAVPLAASLKIVLRVAVESYRSSDFYRLGVDF